MTKGRICTIISSCLACIAVVIGITISCINISPKIPKEDIPQTATQPTNTSGYWTDSGRYGTTPWSGSGTENDPYLIKSAKDLARLSYMVYSGEQGDSGNGRDFYRGVYFKQTAQISLSTYYWRPIGDSNHYFCGYYDGNGYSICDAFTRAGDNNSYSYQGIFGYVHDIITEIKNVRLVDSYIQGYQNVGGIVGYAFMCKISNCYISSTCSVSSSGNFTGGLVGQGDNVTISDCYNSGRTVSSSMGNYTGGIAGGIDVDSSINNSYNLATIKGIGYVGGIVGRNYSSIVRNCFNVGAVTGSSPLGGITGGINNSGEAVKCYYGGSCSSSVGGVEGKDVSGQAVYDSSIVSHAKDQTWFTNSSNWDSAYPWNFGTWGFITSINSGYPVLRRFYNFNVYKLTYDSQGGSAVGQDYIRYSEPYGKRNIYDYNMISDLSKASISNNRLVIDYNNTTGSTQFINFMTKFDWTLAPSAKYTAVIKVESKSYDNFSISFTSPHDTGGNGDPFTQTCSTNITGTGTYIIDNMETKATIAASDCNFRSYIWVSAGQHVKATFSISVFTGKFYYTGNFGYVPVGNMPSCSALPTPARDGYAFEGWYTGKNGTGTNITPSSIFTSSANQTLYAKWRQLDTEAPVIHRGTYVTREDGYDAYVYATDNVGISKVSYPTWTEYNGQDDIQTNWPNNPIAYGTKGTYTIEGKTYNYKYSVNMSDHNNEIGMYNTHVYAYDETGNFAKLSLGDIYFARPWTDFAATSYAGGNGTESSPYEIATAQQLALLAKQSRTDSLEGKYFKQTAPIDLENKATKDSKYVWYMWDGIGVNSYLFSGNYDGGYNSIKNIKMNLTSTAETSAVGLFNRTGFANISNIIMNGGSIKAIVASDVGTIVGCAAISTRDKRTYISNCIVENMKIKGLANTEYSMGGIAGSWVGEIRDCIVKDSVIEGSYVCGITGYNHFDDSVVNCSVLNTSVTGTGTTKIIARILERLAFSYGYGNVNGESIKMMYGDSTAWEGWTYNSAINNGYPIQKSLCWIGDIAPVDSSAIYNRLKTTLGFTEA